MLEPEVLEPEVLEPEVLDSSPFDGELESPVVKEFKSVELEKLGTETEPPLEPTPDGDITIEELSGS